MLSSLIDPRDDAATLVLVSPSSHAAWLSSQPKPVADWLGSLGWKAAPGTFAALPPAEGRPHTVLAAIEDRPGFWSLAGLPLTLPPGAYRLAWPQETETPPPLSPDRAASSWAVGAYGFTRYSRAEREPALLVWPEGADRARVSAVVEAHCLARDLINTPANDLGPAELAAAAEALAGRFEAAVSVVEGDRLIEEGYPLVHAVGRASARAPRLVDIRWSAPGAPPDAPRIAVVGKGVCFDSGGLDLKPAGNMLLMKKDMGGAAHALALAHMIMGNGLPVHLRVLVPAVENAVSSSSFRPLDVYKSRKGLTVEIGNTDAEGRLVLADALAAAADDKPALIIDFATLTGAARVALGPELPAFFVSDEAWAADVAQGAIEEDDPLWRLPLHGPYQRLLKSNIADLSSTGESGMAGAITAALFLQRFVPEGTPWMHLDIYGWNVANRPGRPRGGEAMGLRALYRALARRFGGA